MALLNDMLNAAQAAAGTDWAKIRPDVTTFAQNLVQNTAQTEADLVSGAISKDEAKVQFDQIADYSAILKDYADVAIRLVIQDSFNAAVDVLWKAIDAKIP